MFPVPRYPRGLLPGWPGELSSQTTLNCFFSGKLESRDLTSCIGLLISFRHSPCLTLRCLNVNKPLSFDIKLLTQAQILPITNLHI